MTYQLKHYNLLVFLFLHSFPFSASTLFLYKMSKLPIIEVEHDVHAPASTYYTTGDNARHRTRTHTVRIKKKNYA